MKKILFVYHVSAIGGGSYCLLDILKTLKRDSFIPVVLLPEEGPLSIVLSQMGINVYFVHSLNSVPYNTSLLNFGSIHRICSIVRSVGLYKKVLRAVMPDMVYVNSMMLYPYLRIAKKKGFKTIIHIREHWEKGEHCIQRAIAVNSIVKYADQLVAINKTSAKMFADQKDRITVVYDWRDMSSRYGDWRMEKFFGENAHQLKVFLFTGGLQPIKGVKEVISTFSKVCDEKSRLLILGIDKKVNKVGARQRLKTILQKLGVHFYSQEVYDLLEKDNRIVCAPSNYNITYLLEQAYCVLSYFTIPHANLALAEGIICKTVVIASESDESLEYSGGGKYACLFPANNLDAFEKKIAEIDINYKYLKNNAITGSSFIEKLFDKDINSNKLNTLLETI